MNFFFFFFFFLVLFILAINVSVCFYHVIIFADLSNKEGTMFLEKSKNARKMMMRNSKSMYSFRHA